MVLDCPEPAEPAAFYRSLLGGTVDQPDPRWVLSDARATLHTASGVVLAFQRVTPYRSPAWPGPARPQQFHLDFGVADQDRAEEQMPAREAAVLDSGEGGRGWRICADPAVHPFCLVRH
nr:VOC family protein [Streptomyces sp. SID5643]